MTIRTRTARSAAERGRARPSTVLRRRAEGGHVRSSTVLRLGATGRPGDAASAGARLDPLVHRVRIPLSGAEHPLWTARHAVADQCASRLPQRAVDDLQIIVSELVANVLEHGDGPDGLVIDLTFHGDEVDLQVIGHGDRRLLPPDDEWILPPATKRSGRGLALVRRLSSGVMVGGETPTPDEPGWVTITASVRATTTAG